MLPKNLKYGSKIESAPSRSYRTNIAPQNGTGTYNLGDTIIVNIPTRSNLVLAPAESYLKFNVNVTSSTANSRFRWDSCGAHGIFQRIRIFHGSNLLQDIDNYGLLAKMLFDLQQPTDSCYGKLNVLAGTRADLTLTNPTFAQADFTDNTTANIASGLNAKLGTYNSIVQANTGDSIGSGVFANGAVATQTYALNLVSLVGSLCSSNYFPLFACSSAPLRVEIQLVDSSLKAISSVVAPSTSATPTSVTLTNVEYVGQFIELSDVAVGMIQESLQGAPLQFVVPDYRNYQYTFALANGTDTQVNMPIPAKFSSLKSIFVTARDKGTGTATFLPFSSVKNGITQYYFRIGSQIMPTKPPNTDAEMFAEVIKAMGSLADIAHQPSIDKNSYTLNASTAVVEPISGINSGSFYIGIDVENYAGSSKDSIFAGYNSNTEDIFLVANFTAPSAITARFDAFALFDEVVVFENSTAYVKF
jgi:hypothetical protein